MDVTRATIEDAIATVLGGSEDGVRLRSAADWHWWIEIHRVRGDGALLCEAVTDEFLPRGHNLPADASERLAALAWQVVPGADATLWHDATDGSDVAALADVLAHTLIDVFRHPSSEQPVVEPAA